MIRMQTLVLAVLALLGAPLAAQETATPPMTPDMQAMMAATSPRF